ncbi:hypothetical protein ABFS82_11G021800 [Erythranthe guttata]
MDKQSLMVTLLLVLLFVYGGVVVDVEGIKNCRERVTTKCYPKEKCEARACAIGCWALGHFEESECENHVCICMSGCGPHVNPPAPAPGLTTRHHISPTLRRCLV